MPTVTGGVYVVLLSSGGLVAFSVRFDVDLSRVPENVRAEIEQVVQQIAQVLPTISPTNAFWASMKDSVLQIDVEGVRLMYRIDRTRRELRVVEMQKLFRT